MERMHLLVLTCKDGDQLKDLKEALVALKEGDYPVWGAGVNLRVPELAGVKFDTTVLPTNPPNVCDECGQEYPEDANSVEGRWHTVSCSLRT